MKLRILTGLSAALMLTGCETIQTPSQRQQAQARQQAATRHTDEQIHRLKGQLESMEMENARLMQEVQQLRNDVHSYNSQIAQLNSSMQSLEAKQSREMNELIKRVEALIKNSIGSTRNTQRQPSRGAGYNHVVEPGHTLSAIAAAYGTTVKAIKEANNLKSDNIYVGQKLFIPE